MPDHLAPGVAIEARPHRAPPIAAAGTGTAAFVGPTSTGPCREGDGPGEALELLTSLADYERVHGGLADLALGPGVPATNHLAHAVRAFFNEGGTRLYVSRVVGAGAARAEARVSVEPPLRWRARWPGAAGNGRVHVRELRRAASPEALAQAPLGSVLCLPDAVLCVKRGDGWGAPGQPAMPVRSARELADAGACLLTLAVSCTDRDGHTRRDEGLGLSPEHPRWIGSALRGPVALEAPRTLPPAMLRALLLQGLSECEWRLAGGSDGGEPTPADYRRALEAVAALDDVSIVAAPGSSAYATADPEAPLAIAAALVAHAEAWRAWRVALLDTPPDLTPAQARQHRRRFDSSHAAMYYPWVVAARPLAAGAAPGSSGEVVLPPSGFVAGVWARCDAQHGVHRAPANEVVRGALRFVHPISTAEQELLGPLGLNCLRSFSDRGHRVWGARLLSSDLQWKYVAPRRSFLAIEASIVRGVRWAAFEPNGEALWTRLRQGIADFLHARWREGALQGTGAEQAFFVRCDRSTMGEHDLAEGRVVVLVGVALLRPCEFMVFRVAQDTARTNA